MIVVVPNKLGGYYGLQCPHPTVRDVLDNTQYCDSCPFRFRCYTTKGVITIMELTDDEQMWISSHWMAA